MPNPNTIPTYRYQDIQIPDRVIRNQFQYFMRIGRYKDALKLLSSKQQLQGKAFVADAINKISAGVLNLEKRYDDGVTMFMSELAQQYNALVTNLKKLGEWKNNIQYYPYSCVVYNQEIYFCLKQPPVGTLPTDEEYWLYLGLRGEKGEYGIDVTMKYDWSAETQYKANDVVVYNQNIYVALQDNVGAIPEQNEASWMLFILVTKGEINIGVNPPIALTQNTLWFKTKTNPLNATAPEPIYGQFFRYNKGIEAWEELYVNTVFTLVDDYDKYANIVENIEVDIKPNDWANNQFIYPYQNLDKKKMALIYPLSGYNVSQTKLYGQLKLTINSNSLVLTKPASMEIGFNLPILISIQ